MHHISVAERRSARRNLRNKLETHQLEHSVHVCPQRFTLRMIAKSVSTLCRPLSV
jgi:hypothetical protein